MKTDEQEHKPTAELINRAQGITNPEVRRMVIGEILELRNRYAGTNAEFKAPSGQPSELITALGEELGRQAWYSVRTPSFKKWFGDWETKANAEWVFNAEPVKDISGSEFSKSEKDLVSQVSDFFKSIGGKVDREGLGVVNLTRRGAKSSLAHGIGRAKAAAFSAVPDIITQGKIIDHQTNWKGRNYDTYVIDAPVTISNTEYIAEVVIEQNKNKRNEFYLHEVEIKEKAQSVFKTGMDTGTLQAPLKVHDAFKTATKRGASQASKLIITRKLNEVKGTVSNIIDDNGEPKVVFHGARTLDDFDVFNGRGSNGKIFFTDNIDVAGMFRDDYAYKLIVDGKAYNVSKRTAEDIVNTIEPIEDVEWGIGWNLLDGLDIEKFNGLLEDGTIQTGIDTFTGAENIELEPNDNGLFELFLNIKNPKNIDMQGKEWSLDTEYNNWTFDGGHDGIIVENVVEGGGTAEIDGEDVPPATNYIVENSNQIKSATANNGVYSIYDPSFMDKGISDINKEQIMAGKLKLNSKEISKKVQEHILHSFDSYEHMMGEFENSQKYLGNSPDFGKGMVDTGFFLVYVNDIRKFLHTLTGETPAVQDNKYTIKQSENFYKNLINREIRNILSEDKNYIKPEQQKEQSMAGISEEAGKKSFMPELDKMPEDVWTKDQKGDLYLSHTFRDKKVFFKLQEDKGDYDQEDQGLGTLINFYHDLNSAEKALLGYSQVVSATTDIIEAKSIVEKNIYNIDHGMITSQEFDDIRYFVELQTSQDKKAGYVQGINDINRKVDVIKQPDNLSLKQAEKDNWVLDKKDGSYTLAHTFDINKNIDPATVYFKIKTGNFNGGSVSLNSFLNEEFKAMAGKPDNPHPDHILPGTDINQAMSIVDSTIKKFDSPNANYLYVKSYLASQIHELNQIKKAGYVQGVCECVSVVSGDKALANKLLSEMKVTKTLAKKYAEPETYKVLEQTIFAPKQEQKLERGHHR